MNFISKASQSLLAISRMAVRASQNIICPNRTASGNIQNIERRDTVFPASIF
jgi:hypothetical protein